MKGKKLYFVIFIIIILLVGFIYFGKKANMIPQKDTLTLYYGKDCVHCQDLNKYLEENKIKDKIKLTEKEVVINYRNARELANIAKSCGLDIEQIAVPFLYADGECLQGVDKIASYLSEKVKI